MNQVTVEPLYFEVLRDIRNSSKGGLPYVDHSGMCRSTGVLTLSLEQGLQISVSVWNRIYFLPFGLWNTVGVTFLLPESWYKPTLLLLPLESRCTFTQTHCFWLESQLRLTFFSLEQGIYFHDFVWNRVAKLRLFCLEQGQVPRHSAAHPHPKLRGGPPLPRGNNWVSTKWGSNEGESAWLWNTGDFKLIKFEIASFNCITQHAHNNH